MSWAVPEGAVTGVKVRHRGIHNLGPLDQIPLGEGRRFAVGERLVAVFHARDGQLRATQAACPHQGGNLADGLVGGGKVVCPLHGMRFDLADGHALGTDCDGIETFPVWLQPDGSLVVDIGS